MSTTVQESNNLNIPTDDEAGPSSSGEGANQDGQRRRGGAWTMEYWVGDTILYLCYLMDPNLSATTELVPRSRTTTTRPTGPGPSSNPLTVSLERIVAASNRLRPLAAEADATVSGRRIPDTVVTVDTTEVHSRGTRQAVGAGRGGVNNDDDNENEDMERVPIGHIRGRPPPISRTRYCTARISQHAILDTASMSSRPSRAFSAIRGALAPTFLPRAAVAPTDSQGANGSISTDNAGAEGSSSAQEETIPTESTPATAEILEQPAAPTTLTTAEDARETVEEPAGESSTPVQAGPLPAVRHVQINDGYPGEEEDAILAHRIARMGLPGGGDWRQGDGQSRAFSTVLTSEFFKVPSFAFVSAEDPQTWLWWSTHHENNLQRCRQEGPNEEVMMWWRTRFDDGAMESRARRKQAKKDKRMGRRPFEHIDIKERWRRFWSLKSSVPYRESMEITMRVRGLYYAWREEPYDGTEAMNDLSTLSSHPPRFFTLVRDDSLVMGQRIKGGPVAEIVIHGDDPLESLASAAAAVSSGEVLNGTPPSFLVGEASTHMTETLDAPPYGPISSIRSGGSSITSNNGNTFMTEVSAATGGPVRSTMASTFIHPIPSGRRSGSSSMRYHLSDPETPAPTIGDGDGDGRASVSSDSSSTSSSRSSEQSSSFSPSLRKRSCTIRVLEGINSEVETFALSTGPRLPELFDLFTDQSVPGPSRATFICSIVAFGAVFLVAFITVALTTNINKSDYRT
ncbi:hypothetical protein BGX23_002346 [Mortierella sp. AD031]|nr:hypothetical protein BGX23_002346 [Mortierella sp. AD031]